MAERSTVNRTVPGSSPGGGVISLVMKIFDNNVFRLNPNLTHNTIDTPLAKITIIDDFYEDFGAIVQESDKLPGAVTGCSTPDELIDLRKAYFANMSGTDLPFAKQYTKLVKDIIGYSGEAYTEESLLINCSLILSDKYKDNWYNIHTDPAPPNSWNDRIATVVMLNHHYDVGEGFNLYFHHNPTESLWTAKSSSPRAHHVQGKPNRAILFSPYIWHGPAYSGTQFTTEYRYTQAIFTNLR